VDPRATYTEGKRRAEREHAALEARARTIALLRVVAALAAVVLIGAIAWAHLPPVAWLGVVALVAGFTALVVVPARVHDRRDRAAAAIRFHERGLARLAGEWSKLPNDGARFADDAHPYAGDLDLFGRASLFQRIDTTETRGGEEVLARWLKEPCLEDFPKELARRQDAVRELARKAEWRERLSVAGAVLAEDRPNPEPFVAWAEKEEFSVPSVVRWLARLLPLATIGLFLAGRAGYVHPWAWLASLTAGVALTTAHRGRLLTMIGVASSREGQLARFSEMLHLVETEPFEAPVLAELRAELHASGAGATKEMSRLGRIVGFLDARNNEVFRFFIAPILCWDLNFCIALGDWAQRAGKHVRGWLEVIARAEALASISVLAFEQPAWAFPTLTAEPRFVARGLGHPLLAEATRVVNDVALEGPGHALVVTGSNMSGKSTLLRSMGVNAVLGLAGAPVCATALELGPMQVCTSMRVRDSLEAGVSHFYAELRRLKLVVDHAAGERPVLFLLDEILHGTNSRERLIGARAVVRDLLARGAMGAVSTHDLGLADLESELRGKAKNVHFEEQVDGDKMTFDYKLREGVVQSSNALRLMKSVGLDVGT
jgi:hypothetical protein